MKTSTIVKRILFGIIAFSISVEPLGMNLYAQEYQDQDTIMANVTLKESAQTLELARPQKDISVTEENYYITGTSDPNQPLLCNSEEVEARGTYGTFGVYVPLEMGENFFQFQNGSSTKSVTITRETTSSEKSALTTVLNRCTPSSNDVGYPKQEYLLRCTAPAGATVSAILGDQEYKLKQEAIAEPGIEAYFSVAVRLPVKEDGKVTSIGKIKYLLSYEGEESEKESAGEVFIVGEGATPLAMVSQSAATLYDGAETNSYGTITSNDVCTIAQGAVDSIINTKGNMFQLGMGNWILKDYVDIITDETPYQNEVRSTYFGKDGSGESLAIRGKANSPYKAYMTSEKIYFKFFNMVGLEKISMKSELFSDIMVTPNPDEKTVTIELYKKKPDAVLGYSVSYTEDEGIYIYFNPIPQGGKKPLSGMTVVVDAGHGGYDIGAPGVLYEKGPNEKDITLATATALQNRLTALGAEVVMTVDDTLSKDKKVELTERNQIALENKADVFLSLHCNSVAETSDGTKPSGTEIYYNENNSKLLADEVLYKITAYTDRKTRSVMRGMYYVTRNPLCASMLIELGFVTNPVEYDNMRNPDIIFQTANAIADALITYYQ